MNSKSGELLTENIAGVNRILPHKHKFAWDLFIKSCANNWMPTEISMQNDINQWKNNEISEDEKLLVKRCLGFFFLLEASLWLAIIFSYPLFVMSQTLSAGSTFLGKLLKKAYTTLR